MKWWSVPSEVSPGRLIYYCMHNGFMWWVFPSGDAWELCCEDMAIEERDVKFIGVFSHPTGAMMAAADKVS